MQESTVGEIVGTLRERGPRRKRNGEEQDGKGEGVVTETESERLLRERTGKGRSGVN